MSRLRRSLPLLFLIVALVTTTAHAAPNFYYQKVSASQTNSAITFGFPAGQVSLVSDGASDNCFYEFTSSTATTSSPQIKSTEFFNWFFPGDGVSSMGIICSSGQTATVRVYAK